MPISDADRFKDAFDHAQLGLISARAQETEMRKRIKELETRIQFLEAAAPLAEHNEIMLSRALVILADVEKYLRYEGPPKVRVFAETDILIRIENLTADASIVDLPTPRENQVTTSPLLYQIRDEFERLQAAFDDARAGLQSMRVQERKLRERIKDLESQIATLIAHEAQLEAEVAKCDGHGYLRERVKELEAHVHVLQGELAHSKDGDWNRGAR